MNRSTYTVATAPGFICITDENRGGRSVTNDAEEVIADLLEAGYDLTANRVIYCDSEGVWDELVVRHWRFAGFRPLRAPNVSAAIAAAEEKP